MQMFNNKAFARSFFFNIVFFVFVFFTVLFRFGIGLPFWVSLRTLFSSLSFSVSHFRNQQNVLPKFNWSLFSIFFSLKLNKKSMESYSSYPVNFPSKFPVLFSSKFLKTQYWWFYWQWLRTILHKFFYRFFLGCFSTLHSNLPKLSCFSIFTLLKLFYVDFIFVLALNWPCINTWTHFLYPLSRFIYISLQKCPTSELSVINLSVNKQVANTAGSWLSLYHGASSVFSSYPLRGRSSPDLVSISFFSIFFQREKNKQTPFSASKW